MARQADHVHDRRISRAEQRAHRKPERQRRDIWYMAIEAFVAPAELKRAMAGKPLRHGAERDGTMMACCFRHRLARQHHPGMIAVSHDEDLDVQLAWPWRP